MMKLAMTLLAALALSATDATGTWDAVAETRFPSGKVESHSLTFAFKQDGAALTGSVGPTVQHQIPIDKGRVSGESLFFDCKWGNGALRHFVLVAAGDSLRGQAQGDASQVPAHPDENYTNTIYLTLTRKAKP